MVSNKLSKKAFWVINNSKGFSLIEAIVAIVIIGIMASLLSVYLLAGISTFDKVQSRKIVVTDASESLVKFTREVSLTYNVFNTTAKNIQLTTTLDTLLLIDYEINSDGTFTRKLGAGSKELIARNLDYNNSGINYYYLDGNLRRIRISLALVRNGEITTFSADISPETLRG